MRFSITSALVGGFLSYAIVGISTGAVVGAAVGVSTMGVAGIAAGVAAAVSIMVAVAVAIGVAVAVAAMGAVMGAAVGMAVMEKEADEPIVCVRRRTERTERICSKCLLSKFKKWFQFYTDYRP